MNNFRYFYSGQGYPLNLITAPIYLGGKKRKWQQNIASKNQLDSKLNTWASPNINNALYLYIPRSFLAY